MRLASNIVLSFMVGLAVALPRAALSQASPPRLEELRAIAQRWLEETPTRANQQRRLNDYRRLRTELFRLPREQYLSFFAELNQRWSTPHAAATFALAQRLQTAWEADYLKYWRIYFLKNTAATQIGILLSGIAAVRSGANTPAQISASFRAFRTLSDALKAAAGTALVGAAGVAVVPTDFAPEAPAIGSIPPAPAELLGIAQARTEEEWDLHKSIEDLVAYSAAAGASTASFLLQTAARGASQARVATAAGSVVSGATGNPVVVPLLVSTGIAWVTEVSLRNASAVLQEQNLLTDWSRARTELEAAATSGSNGERELHNFRIKSENLMTYYSQDSLSIALRYTRQLVSLAADTVQQTVGGPAHANPGMAELTQMLVQSLNSPESGSAAQAAVQNHAQEMESLRANMVNEYLASLTNTEEKLQCRFTYLSHLLLDALIDEESRGSHLTDGARRYSETLVEAMGYYGPRFVQRLEHRWSLERARSGLSDKVAFLRSLLNERKRRAHHLVQSGRICRQPAMLALQLALYLDTVPLSGAEAERDRFLSQIPPL